MKGKSPLDILGTALATLGPIGHFPKAPGTWGSLAAVIAAPWLFLPLPLWGRVAVLVVVFAVGTWACGVAERTLDRKDPGCVIIDELFGQWLTLLFFASMPIWYLGLAFVLFRIFDILKPWPVRWAETAFAGGLGVMADDGVAGLYALLCLHLIALIL
ncbi:MAG: phosphatidylglycerophosphatase A [Pseudodesulfovibrio sp.]|uniref:Phosphatidylglycerophosphatase A n=1 Tax=Pseudodesulfovibrio aespoeensis (strain ATCC 700646 / DSM 10631 / Aspo-2) TaxID=643562 RepID=E6VVZ2_PSEA9|nr:MULTISPECIES: phosphatidylglycerophosphatase A [Pseudodesulfovibrio]MBU4380329.1 phosphatidylglycerophosphatase A [Pseudomonadota bacterium]ADU62437.1 phosphatidylglycerophosphatase A [Pseudodesulfovibrio aespoeensis Aspo-2]MBU4473898.1 phosphatidylglycerophosphatase A [Pseudomonadota bacterium]MBU4515096.1 phosphatidylglycerophosphatase A [Pseudomonadota bacterium]MBU4521001.1 phosphatidylglycerophosphatase A [Pseudomonadota bacterium]